MKDQRILITGAGPSGLSLAIFLKELGYAPRIIDKKPVISEYSKALGVNPNTLGIFDQYNITPRFLEKGRKMHGVNLWQGSRLVLHNSFSSARSKYPFLIILPQKESEQILLEEAEKRNIKVEYGTQLLSFEKKDGAYSSKLMGEDESTYDSDILIGADGGHSEVRKQSGISLQGFRYKESWEIYDAELDTPVPPDDTSIILHPTGGLIMIRIRDNVWRLGGNLHDLLNYLPKGTHVGRISWQTKFNISHSIAQSLVKDNAVLIGDAAHLHSPIGGRGMNLGIEDASILSRLIQQGRLQDYERSRLPYLQRTVKRVNTMTQFFAGQGLPGIAHRNAMLFKPFLQIAKTAGRDFALGLDK